MALRELLVSLGVQVDSKDLTGLEGRLSGAFSGLKKLGGLLIGGVVINGIKGFVTSQIELADHLNDTALKLGVSTNELQRFQYAAKLGGVEADSAAQALNIFNKNVGGAATGNAEAAASFKKLGVNVKDSNGQVGSTFDLLSGVAEGVASLGSQQEKTAALMKIFGKQGAALGPVLAGGAEGLRAMSEQFDKLGGGLDDEYIQAIAKAGDATDDMQFSLTFAKAQIMSAFLPAVVWIIKRATELFSWFTRLSKQIGGFGNILKVLAVGGIGFAALKMASLIKTAGGVGKALKSAFGLGPKELLVIGSIILLALLVEDLVAFVQGKDSILGDLFKSFMGEQGALEFAQQLRDIWTQVGESMTSLGPVLADVLNQLGPQLIAILPAVAQALAVLVKVIAAAASAMAGLIGGVAAVIKGEGVEGFAKAMDASANAIFGTRKEGDNSFLGEGGLFGHAAAPPPMYGPGGAIGPPTAVQVTQTINTPVSITGATDPKATADAVAQKQRSVNGQANRDAMGAMKVAVPSKK